MIELFTEPGTLVEVAQDIYSCPFLTEDYCHELMVFGQRSEQWRRNLKDKKYSTVDLILKDNNSFAYEQISQVFLGHICPQLYKIWSISPIEISQMFMVYYSKKLQTSLALHHDDSFVTGSIKLNKEYEGAEVVFPRQKFSNKDVPVGNILVWPSQVTHPHKCTELKAGEKYSLTIWTDESDSAD